MLLYGGEIVADGHVDDVISTYQDNPLYVSNLRHGSDSTPDADDVSIVEDSPAVITGVTFLNGEGNSLDVCRTGSRLVARIGYYARERIEKPIFEVWFQTADGTDYAAYTTAWDNCQHDHIEGEGFLDLVVDPVSLIPGKYVLSVAVTAEDGITRYDWHVKRYWLNVKADRYVQGLVFLPHAWSLEPSGSGSGTSSTDVDVEEGHTRPLKRDSSKGTTQGN
jgi:hypothetical protein